MLKVLKAPSGDFNNFSNLSEYLSCWSCWDLPTSNVVWFPLHFSCRSLPEVPSAGDLNIQYRPNFCEIDSFGSHSYLKLNPVNPLSQVREEYQSPQYPFLLQISSPPEQIRQREFMAVSSPSPWFFSIRALNRTAYPWDCFPPQNCFSPHSPCWPRKIMRVVEPGSTGVKHLDL